MADKAIKTNGNKKCKTKNLLSVGLDTLKPPHNQFTIYFPTTGLAPIILVITVAPHNDI
jgi:hypothetical protein